MPFINSTNTIRDEEKRELDEAYDNNIEVKLAIDQFNAECKLRRELTEARKQNNLSQIKLKELTGLTQQTISRIEKNSDISPSLKNLIKYVNAIGYELTLQPKESKIAYQQQLKEASEDESFIKMMLECQDEFM